MDANLKKAFNDQINKELYSAYLYLSMAAYCEAQALPGCAHWMKMQAQEEMNHAMMFYNYLNDRGERVIMQAIEEPENDFSSLRDVFEKVLAHEKKVTESINDIYRITREVIDPMSEMRLHWFISEQVEEKSAQEVLDKLALVEEQPAGMYMLDQLGARPAPVFPAE